MSFIGNSGLVLRVGEVINNITNPTVNAVSAVAIDSESYVDQNPSATNTPLQVSFGGASATTYASLAADGLITILQTGYYEFRVRLNVGRSTSTGVSNTLARLLVNGSQVGPTQSLKLNGVQFNIPLEFTFALTLPATTQITFQILRDSSGANDGGIFAFDPTPAGWNNAASADLLITHWTGLT